MIRDPQLRAAFQAAFAAWEKWQARQPGGQLTLSVTSKEAN